MAYIGLEGIQIIETATYETQFLSDEGLFGYTSLSWSPDENEIIFSAITIEEGTNSLYYYSIIDKNFLRVTPWDAHEEDPMWSPDGKWIVFSSTHHKREHPDGPTYLADLFLMDASCIKAIEACPTPLIQVTFGQEGQSFYRPNWAPDSQKIVFDNHAGYDVNDVFISDIISKNIINITPNFFGTAYDSQWAPDGSMIAFSFMEFDEDTCDIYVYDTFSEETVNITENIDAYLDFLFWLEIE